MKAKFIGKYYGTGFDRDYVYLEYEYRGRKYEVYKSRTKWNEPLSRQHKNAQARIDDEIETEERAKKSQNKARTLTVDDRLFL